MSNISVTQSALFGWPPFSLARLVARYLTLLQLWCARHYCHCNVLYALTPLQLTLILLVLVKESYKGQNNIAQWLLCYFLDIMHAIHLYAIVFLLLLLFGVYVVVVALLCSTRYTTRKSHCFELQTFRSRQGMNNYNNIMSRVHHTNTDYCY